MVRYAAAGVVYRFRTGKPGGPENLRVDGGIRDTGEGQRGVEFWDTAATKDIQTRNSSDWTQQVELEYGITDHFNVSLYQVYEQGRTALS